MKITIEDVAREASVSIATVSRVINDNYPVNAKTKEKVLATIQKLNFKPNSLAKSLVQKKTNTIGVLIPSTTNIYFAMVVNGLQDFFIENGYHILLCDSRGEAKYEKELIESLKDKYVDGIISIDPSTVNIKNNFYKEINSQLPLILVNGYNEGIKLNFVMNDQKAGTREALEYLISLGHKNIALMRGKNSYSYELKEEVYRNVMLENNIPINEKNILVIEKGNSIETVDLAFDSFYKRLLSKNDTPTAIYCSNDWMAVGSLYATQKLTLSVPNDVSIIGNDNIIISDIIRPNLTTVDQNMYRLGKIAAEQLFKLIKEPNSEPVKIILNTKLIHRDSCKKI